MTKKEVKELLERYRSGHCTAEEKDLLEKWYDQAKADDLDFQLEELEQIKNASWNDKVNPNRKIVPISSVKNKNLFAFWKIASAAVLVIALAFTINYHLTDYPFTHEQEYSSSQNIQPGGNSATLLMEDGQEINLDDLPDGHQIKMGTSLLEKNKDGELVISILPSSGTPISHVSFNTIRTPKGGNYKVILADGTNVWLNSSSVLRFPTVFNNNERRVELAGEGYFDVIEDRNKPFIVFAKGQEVRVLGTEFNVSAYADEDNIKTTLIKGSVSVLYKNQMKTIRPGEQSIVDKNGLMKIHSVDVAFAKAWKEGYFAFDKLSVEEAMNQISRWYDVPVSFEGSVPNKELTGQISRKVDLSTIVEIMEFNGMDLEIRNNRLIVKE